LKEAFLQRRGITMEHAASKEYVKVSKQEYDLLKEIYRTVKRQAFLVRIDEAERNLAAGKTKAMTVDDFIDSV
jgi:hypothetical protein